MRCSVISPKIVKRKKSNSKQKSLEQLLPSMRAYHGGLSAMLSAPEPGGDPASLDPKWGRFVPSRRVNVDQVPLPFVADNSYTYDIKGTKVVRIQQPQEGDSKRFATLVLAFSPVGASPKVGLIFRGKGMIGKVELASYEKLAPNVQVFSQKNAWADRIMMVEWVDKVWRPFTESGADEYLLLADNLDAHNCDAFRAAVQKTNTLLWFGPPGATHLWQPVDANEGALLKQLYDQVQDEWLDVEENMTRWEGKVSVSDRRMLILEWTEKAWQLFCGANHNHSRHRAWERTGGLMTADGSGDDLIKPEGTSEYKFARQLPKTATTDNGPEAGGSGGAAGGGYGGTQATDSDVDSDDAADANDDPESQPLSFAAAVKEYVCPAGSELGFVSERPADVSRSVMLNEVVAYRFPHGGWAVGTVRASSRSAGSNFVVAFDGEDSRLTLCGDTYAAGSAMPMRTPSSTLTIFVSSEILQFGP